MNPRRMSFLLSELRTTSVFQYVRTIELSGRTAAYGLSSVLNKNKNKIND